MYWKSIINSLQGNSSKFLVFTSFLFFYHFFSLVLFLFPTKFLYGDKLPLPFPMACRHSWIFLRTHGIIIKTVLLRIKISLKKKKKSRDGTWDSPKLCYKGYKPLLLLEHSVFWTIVESYSIRVERNTQGSLSSTPGSPKDPPSHPPKIIKKISLSFILYPAAPQGKPQVSPSFRNSLFHEFPSHSDESF